MRIWIDLANSPHVLVAEPIVARLRADGHEVFLTARDHAQTVELARMRWPEVEIVAGESPPGRMAKAGAIAGRARDLRRLGRRHRPDVAFSHGSYAQLAAARTSGIPAVTMMDYEHQPANHLSFRLARSVVVPAAFPERALRRSGARSGKVRVYDGFKEELYLAGFRPDPSVLTEVGVAPGHVLVVMRPAPEGALYHRGANERFDALLDEAGRRDDVRVVVLPRTEAQRARYSQLPSVLVPERALDGRSLLAQADVVVGAGGTMNREAALLGTPTYTVFAGRLAAVDAELIRAGLLHDLRTAEGPVPLRKKEGATGPVSEERARAILNVVVRALEDVLARRGGAAPVRAPLGRQGGVIEK